MHQAQVSRRARLAANAVLLFALAASPVLAADPPDPTPAGSASIVAGVQPAGFTSWIHSLWAQASARLNLLLPQLEPANEPPTPPDVSGSSPCSEGCEDAGPIGDPNG